MPEDCSHLPSELIRTDIRLLPSSMSKRSIWRIYKAQMEALRDIAIGYSTFCKLWRQLIPFLVITKPMTDLCWRNSTALSRLAEKSATLKAYTEHLEEVHKERSLYKTVCDQSRVSIRSEYTRAGTFTPPPLLPRIEPNSVPLTRYASVLLWAMIKIMWCVHRTLTIWLLHRYTIPVILCNQAPFTFWHRGSVLYLG